MRVGAPVQASGPTRWLCALSLVETESGCFCVCSALIERLSAFVRSQSMRVYLYCSAATLSLFGLLAALQTEAPLCESRGR